MGDLTELYLPAQNATAKVSLSSRGLKRLKRSERLKRLWPSILGITKQVVSA